MVKDDLQSQSSHGGSVYMPPGSEALSDGYQSFGDTDSLGSQGQLVEDDDANWLSSMLLDV